MHCPEDEQIPPLLKKEQLKSNWEDEDVDENDVKDSWEDEDEPAPVWILLILSLFYRYRGPEVNLAFM